MRAAIVRALILAPLCGCGDEAADERDPSTDTLSAFRAVAAAEPASLIPKGADWRCWDSGGTPPGDWRMPGYDPAPPWKLLPLPGGYGESYLASTLSYGPDPSNKHITSCFRRDFFVENPSQVMSLRLDVMYDDGFVVYVNGQEAGRAAMPSGPVTASTLSTGHEAGNAYVSFDASAAKGALILGWNTLAVEVHQQAPSSSDLVFDASLDAVVDPALEPPSPTLFGIPRRDVWRYWDKGPLAGTDWSQSWFGDNDWFYGRGPLGYGESYLATTISFGPDASSKRVTSYFRKDFEVPDPTVVSRVVGQIMFDDGAVVYLNGTEIARVSMPSGPVAPSTPASGHEAGNAYLWLDWTAHLGLLLDGPKTIAVEVHQQTPASSDLVFDLALVLEGGAPPPLPEQGIARGSFWRYFDQGMPPPDWKTSATPMWEAGRAPLGYGEPYLETEVSYGPDPANKHVTTSFRNEFFVGDPSAIGSIAGELMYDDGVVVYVNGHEIGRAHLPAGPVAFGTLASGHEAGNAYESFDWTHAKNVLVEGVNVVAVEVHQQAPSSSDLVFDLSLTIEWASPPSGMVWAKHGGNPLAAGEFPSVVRRSATQWELFYESSPPDPSVWRAVSSDGVSWSGATQVLPPTAGFNRREPFVLFDGAVYRLWFRDASGIRAATSPDGLSWSVQPAPAIPRGGTPTVLFDGALWRMWYSHTFHPDDLVGQISFGHATSADGATWTDHGEVFALGRVAQRLTVVQEGPGFRGWLHGFGWNPPSDIRFAVSSDGFSWEVAPDAVLWASGGWEGESVGQPFVMRVGSQLRMYYVGFNYGSGTPQIGLALNPP